MNSITLVHSFRSSLLGVVASGGVAILASVSPMHAQEVAQLDKPRVALMLSPKKAHHNEFDDAFATLQWEAERFPSTEEDMKTLVSRLGEFDILLTAPLFDPTNANLSEEDLKKFKKFIEDGGVIAVTDGSYQRVRRWLASIDPAFDGIVEGKCNSTQWTVNGATVDPEPAHPLRFFPWRITEPNSWPHFHQPSSDSQWKVVSNCSEGYPVTFAQNVGKGFISVSALRQPSFKQLENFHANLKLDRLGLKLKTFELPAAAIGKGTLKMDFAEELKSSLGTVIYEITPKGGKPQRFEGDAIGKGVEFGYRFDTRGPVTLRLLFRKDGSETVLFEREATIPEFLTVKPNAYRGLLSTERRSPIVHFGIELAPDEEDVSGMNLTVSVLDEKGGRVASYNRVLASNDELAFRIPVNLPQNLPAGEYKLQAALTKGNARVATSESSFKILAPREAQTIVDEDNTLLVNGKPFFPIGLYHVRPEDYPAVADLGINTVQYWIWHKQAGLDAAKAHGLKTIFELTQKNEKIVQDVVKQYGEDPAILLWYGIDEPHEASYGRASTVLKTFNESDDHHPVYMVSVRSDIFAQQQQFANVFAIDPYGTTEKVHRWTTKAGEAVEHRKAVICVPGTFGEETPETLRSSAYAALANNVRGIVWYPWSQVGGGPVGIGLKNSPQQQAVIKEICGEIKALTPALTAVERVPFESQDDKLQGIFCSDSASGNYIILVNVSEEPFEGEVAIPLKTRQLNAQFNDFFNKENKPLPVSDNRFKIKLNPHETRAFHAK